MKGCVKNCQQFFCNLSLSFDFSFLDVCEAGDLETLESLLTSTTLTSMKQMYMAEVDFSMHAWKVMSK